ncbi:MAG TPA: alcohol dehydrogenase catalytic domain-containing protein, partial [Methylophaga sp.]|nr:alcohol dehydrogenase catalytic domain-containing protein [Methylophaga sp.]
MSRVVRFHQTGGPEVLQIDDLTVGEPGPNELKLRIEAIGLNRAEAMFRSSQYLEAPKPPALIGYEAAAIVEAVGNDSCAFKVGDKVSVIPAFSMNQYGTYADVALLPVSAVVKRPDNLSAEQAAAVWMQYLTAWGGLIDIGHLSQHQVLLIPAASSSVGLAAIQIANQVGAVAVAITRSAEKSEL